MLVIKRKSYEKAIFTLPNGERITIEQRPGGRWSITLPEDVQVRRAEIPERRAA